jgi:hypothetical protein
MVPSSGTSVCRATIARGDYFLGVGLGQKDGTAEVDGEDEEAPPLPSLALPEYRLSTLG